MSIEGLGGFYFPPNRRNLSRSNESHPKILYCHCITKCLYFTLLQPEKFTQLLFLPLLLSLKFLSSDAWQLTHSAFPYLRAFKHLQFSLKSMEESISIGTSPLCSVGGKTEVKRPMSDKIKQPLFVSRECHYLAHFLSKIFLNFGTSL